ncbi:hypothetical protein LZZ85_06205 [Terrimonas sp. NA20]|uniref:Uncharacterized protein n=1 Tax=Terrimonas ginsenosidimutans TaxID=2908004 RepID=A0ABS9KNF8_9BACT|nr:hypothetical protein [Terrimonas ginsenosidimutans]MCG2613863.1 hypothetical protein [Terrimonas ginsenosidimutans]
MSTINFQDSRVPEWAGFFSKEEFVMFMGYVSDYFKGSDVSYAIAEGAVSGPGGNGRSSEKMGLINLAQFCRLQPIEEWGAMISNHFDGIRKAASFEKEFSGKAHDFACVRDLIGVRLYPEEYVSAIKTGLAMGKLMAEGLYALLVFDFPDSIVNIRPEQSIQWPLSTEELFGLGIRNTRKKYPLNLFEQDFDGIPISFVVENHFYAPNILFNFLEEKPDPEYKGMLIGLPNRHAALMHRITDMKVLQAIHRMIPAIYGMNKEGPGSVSDKLYWLHEGEVIVLPYTLDAENIHFDPPENFIALLRELEGDGGCPRAVAV